MGRDVRPAGISAKTIASVLTRLADHEGGDWVLLGGGLAKVAFGSKRATEDIDLVAKDGASNEARARLFASALAVGLPVEALNSAADFFLYSLPRWEARLALHFEGKKGRIFRPDLTLFLALKLARASEADLEDCRAAVAAEGIDSCDLDLLREWLRGRKLPARAKAYLAELRGIRKENRPGACPGARRPGKRPNREPSRRR